MRNTQNPAPEGAVDYNAGINSLPGYSGEVGSQEIANTYDPYSLQYQAPTQTPAPSFVPTANPVSIPKATPAAQDFMADPWRNNAASFRNNYPAPGTPISYPAPGTPFGGAALEPQQGFFARLLNSITGGLSGVGDMFDNLHGGAQPARQTGGGMLMSDRTFNSYRGAFSPTYQQLSGSPGSSMIGPTSGLVSNPYTGKVIGGGDHSTRAPAYAQAFSNVVKSRNII